MLAAADAETGGCCLLSVLLPDPDLLLGLTALPAATGQSHLVLTLLSLLCCVTGVTWLLDFIFLMTVCHDFLFSILCYFLSSHSERVTLNSSPQTSVNQSDAHLPAQALMHRLESFCMLGRLHARSQRSQWRWGVVWGLPSVAPGFRRRDNGRNVIDPSSSLEKDKTAQQTGEWLALGLVPEGTHWLLPPESLLTDKARWCGSLQAEADWGPLSYPPPHLFDLCLLPCLWLNLFGNHITSAAPANDIFAPPQLLSACSLT